jgi:hypothetical protein
MATPPTATTQQDIQNSERLLDLSNQLIDSINERKKVLKGINAEEQLYFATVKQQQKLSQDIAANAEKYLGYQIKSKDLAKQKKAVEDNALKSLNAFKKIEGDITKQYQNSLKANTELTEQLKKETKENLKFNNSVDSTRTLFQDLLTRRERGEQISRRDLAIARRRFRDAQEEVKNSDILIKDLQERQQKQENIAKTAAEIIKNGKESLKAQQKEIEFLERNLKIRKQIEKSTGLLGGMAKAASKIPGIGQYLNADEAIDEMEKLAAKIEEGGGKATSFGNRMKIAGKGLQVLAKGAYDNLKSPEAVFTFFLKAALTANEQAVKLGKSLGYGADRADAFREKLAGIERSTNNLNVNTKNLVEAYGELATATGFAYEFTEDQLVTQIKLTKQVGLTADEAAQVQRFAVLNNKTSEETYKSFLKGITAARNQLKVGIDFKATLAEASKISGQLAAQLGNNPELIGRAIVSAKALGMTLEQVAKAGSTLLDFGTSISNELEAELLTGKQINLERARAAALAGDQITLAEELAKNMGTAAEFTKLNKLQQDSLAKSIGMSSDELAETLRKREEAIASGKSLAQITEEEAQQALERQSVQDKFNTAIEKLQSLIGNLLAGPLGGFLDILSSALNIVNLIGNAFSFLVTPLRIVAGLYLAIQATQLAINAGKAIEIGYLVRQAAIEGGILNIQNMQYLLGKQSMGVKIAAYALSLRELAISKIQTIYEKMQLGYTVGQKAIAMGYNGILIARQALLSGELAKSIAIAAAWAVANPFTALAGLAVAGTVAAGLYALTADDMVDPGYGKRTLLSPEGTIKLNDKDTVIAGTNLGGGKPSESLNKTNPETITPQIDLTPMISAINEVRTAIDRLYSKDQSINMDGKKVGTTLVQNSYKVA